MNSMLKNLLRAGALVIATTTFAHTAVAVFNVRDYGAMGNSNGTPGDGHDDTGNINNAIAAAIATATVQNLTGSVVYLPCGTYRITAPITSASTTSSFHFVGDGPCTQIYNDNATPFSSMVFNPASNYGGVAPGFSIRDIYFIAPTAISTFKYAIELTNISNPIFQRLSINGYGHGIKLVRSYSPHIMLSAFSGISGAVLECTADDSCNSGYIWMNLFSSVGNGSLEYALKIGPGNTGGCTTNPTAVSIVGNDIERSYGGPQFFGSCAVSLRDNYVADNSHSPFDFQAGYNQAVKIEGNFFAENGAAFTFALANVAGVDFGTNSWYNQSITYSGLTAINWSTFQSVTGSGSLANYCTEAMKCSYIGNGWIKQWGTGQTSGGTATVTFPLSCPNNLPTELTVSNANNAGGTVYIGGQTKTQMTVTSSIAALFFSWSITCN